jgi:hypothetical protein
MNGEIGSYLMAAVHGSAVARQHIREIFGKDFQNWAGWTNLLDQMPGGNVNLLLNRQGAWWNRECFQALYVACWIHHPVAKGSFMIKLDPPHDANVRAAYGKLLSTGEIQSRISSHLSKKGASAHEGWDFLRGYGELLIQIEGEAQHAPYLFLKCEGHALESGLSLSTIMHGLSWVQKTFTGAGAVASPELEEWAKASRHVEGRAAENFGKSYEKHLKQLGLPSRRTTVEQVIEALYHRAGFSNALPAQIRGNTRALGRAMLGPQGFIALFKKQRSVLKKNKVDFDDKFAAELTAIAERMLASSADHAEQNYQEIRVTPQDLQTSLDRFRSYIT